MTLKFPNAWSANGLQQTITKMVKIGYLPLKELSIKDVRNQRGLSGVDILRTRGVLQMQTSLLFAKFMDVRPD